MTFRWFIALLLFASPVFAQSTITGTVTDPQSAVIPDARVALLGGPIELRTTRTDGQGRYRFDAVQPGTYIVAVSAPGFQQAASSDIVLTTGQGATRDVRSRSQEPPTSYRSKASRAPGIAPKASRRWDRLAPRRCSTRPTPSTCCRTS